MLISGRCPGKGKSSCPWRRCTRTCLLLSIVWPCFPRVADAKPWMYPQALEVPVLKTGKPRSSPLARWRHHVDREEYLLGFTGSVHFYFPVSEDYSAGEYLVDETTGQTVQTAAENARDIVTAVNTGRLTLSDVQSAAMNFVRLAIKCL